MSYRIPIHVTMGTSKCVGSSSRTLGNTIYRSNCADLHIEGQDFPMFDESGKPVMTMGPDDKPVQRTERRRVVVGLKLKPFVVMAVRGVRHRVSRKQIMADREAEAEPFPDASSLESIEAPEKTEGLTVGQDSGFRPDQAEKEAAAKEAEGADLLYGARVKFGMGESDVDRAAAQHIADMSAAMGGGRSRGLVPLIQSRGYSGHGWEFGDTHLDFDELWERLTEKERAFLYDEVMAIVQDDSPTKAKDTNPKELLAPDSPAFKEILPSGSLKR